MFSNREALNQMVKNQKELDHKYKIDKVALMKAERKKMNIAPSKLLNKNTVKLYKQISASQE